MVMWIDNVAVQCFPFGEFEYLESKIIGDGVTFLVSENGEKLTSDENSETYNNESITLTLKRVTPGSVRTETLYNSPDETLKIMFESDGSIRLYENGVDAGIIIPASAIEYYDYYYTLDGNFGGAIYPDGSKIQLDDAPWWVSE